MINTDEVCGQGCYIAKLITSVQIQPSSQKLKIFSFVFVPSFQIQSTSQVLE